MQERIWNDTKAKELNKSCRYKISGNKRANLIYVCDLCLLQHQVEHKRWITRRARMKIWNFLCMRLLQKSFFWDEKIFFGKILADILFPGYSQKSIFGFNGFHMFYAKERIFQTFAWYSIKSNQIKSNQWLPASSQCYEIQIKSLFSTCFIPL